MSGSAVALGFDVTTEMDAPTGTAYLVVQETNGPGCSLRIGFDPYKVDGAYMAAVMAAFPEVVSDYMREVAAGGGDV